MLQRLPGETIAEQKRSFINEIDRLLSYESKKTTTYGLPQATALHSELDIIRQMQGQLDPEAELQELLAQGLNEQQEQIFRLVQEAYTRKGRAIIFVQVARIA